MSVLNRKIINFNPVTDGYTRPLSETHKKLPIWEFLFSY